jgi:hypothetical protein
VTRPATGDGTARSSRPGDAAAPCALAPPPPGGRGAAAPVRTHPNSHRANPSGPTHLAAARMVDADMTPVWQHYGQACVHCGRVFDPDEHPDTDAPAIPGQRPTQRRCATDCRTDHGADRRPHGRIGLVTEEA